MDGTTQPSTPHAVTQLSPAAIIARAQIRKHFDADELRELADSLRDQGMIQPIVVRTLAAADAAQATATHEIVAGERRWRAAMIAGLDAVPVIVRDDLSDTDAIVMQAVENLQRVQLSLPEQCDGVSALVHALGLPETCKRLGKSKAWVSKRASVNDMPEPVRNLIGEGLIKDVEIASTLTQISHVDAVVAKRLIQTVINNPHRTDALTRERAAQELHWAKEEAEQDRKAKATEAQRAAQADKAALEEAKQQIKLKERERLMARVKEARKALKDSAMQGLQTGLRLTDKQVNGWPRAIHVDYVAEFPGTGGSVLNKFPETAETCSFDFFATGDVDRLDRAAGAFAKKMLVQVQVPELTLEQALRLETALKDLKGKITMRIEARVTGRELQQAVKRLNGAGAGKPVSSPEKQGDLGIAVFLDECVNRKNKAAKTKAADLHAAYVRWCKRNKHAAIAFNDNAWGDAIAAAGIEKKRISTGVHYIGCAL